MYTYVLNTSTFICSGHLYHNVTVIQPFVVTPACRLMGRSKGTSSRSLSSWRRSRDGNINTRKSSLCMCPACGPRGRRVTAQTFDKHTLRIWTGLLHRDPEPLGALYEQYRHRSRMRDGDTSTSDLDDEPDHEQFDGCLSDPDQGWPGVGDDADAEPGVDVGIDLDAPPAPPHDREPDDEFRSPHAPAYLCTLHIAIVVSGTDHLTKDACATKTNTVCARRTYRYLTRQIAK
jgi:hypothetical protein